MLQRVADHCRCRNLHMMDKTTSGSGYGSAQILPLNAGIEVVMLHAAERLVVVK